MLLLRAGGGTKEAWAGQTCSRCLECPKIEKADRCAYNTVTEKSYGTFARGGLSGEMKVGNQRGERI